MISRKGRKIDRLSVRSENNPHCCRKTTRALSALLSERPFSPTQKRKRRSAKQTTTHAPLHIPFSRRYRLCLNRMAPLALNSTAGTGKTGTEQMVLKPGWGAVGFLSRFIWKHMVVSPFQQALRGLTPFQLQNHNGAAFKV